jgi:predicted nucleic acid-binding protein
MIMRIEATFDTSFWVHIVYLDQVDVLLADYDLVCTEAVASELGRDNPTSQRLQALLTAGTIQSATPRVEQATLYGEGERAAINLALERRLPLLIDDWRPYEAARMAGVRVVNTPAYLVQLYAQGRLTLNQVLSDLGRLTRRGTLRPEWLQSALEIVAEMRQRGLTHE